MTNKLFYSDNLEVLRDQIALDGGQRRHAGDLPIQHSGTKANCKPYFIASSVDSRGTKR